MLSEVWQKESYHVQCYQRSGRNKFAKKHKYKIKKMLNMDGLKYMSTSILSIGVRVPQW